MTAPTHYRQLDAGRIVVALDQLHARICERFPGSGLQEVCAELRVILHVIDMHQLTKDPTAAVSIGGKTASSPARTLTPYELSRYLDYCSEMMSLTAKVAVLFAQSLPDPIVTEAVSDIERIAAGMSQKVWQKITMLDATIRAVPSLSPPAPAAPASGLTPPARAEGAKAEGAKAEAVEST